LERIYKIPTANFVLFDIHVADFYRAL